MFFSLYPRICISCHKELGVLCELCRLELDLLTEKQCVICGYFSQKHCRCTQKKLNHIQSLSIYPYHCGLSQCLQIAKYGAQHDFSAYQTLLDFAVPELKLKLQTNQSVLTQNLDKIDILCVIPPQKKRLFQRGYSAPYLFAKTLARMKVFPNAKIDLLLKNQRYEKQQTSKSIQERWDLSGLFALSLDPFKIQKSYAKPIDQLKVIVIDDVSTTGSTFFHSAEVLQEAGFLADHIFSLSVFGGSDQD